MNRWSTEDFQFSQFSHSVMSNSLKPHWLQHARLPCQSPTPGVFLNSCSLSWWCHPTISSSTVPFSSCLQSFLASESSHHVAKVLEFQLQHQSFQWIFRTDFLEDWLVWLPYCPRDCQESSPPPQFKRINYSVLSFLYGPCTSMLSHPYITTGKTIAWIRGYFVGKVRLLHFNTLPRLVRAFLPRSKHLLISWLQSPSTVILEPKKIKSVTVSIVFPSICHEWWDQMPWS